MKKILPDISFIIRKAMLFVLFNFLAFFSLNCTQDSALSDVTIDDPSVIKPIIFINKSITTSSVMYTNVTWLYDKNDNSIELKSGKVEMNNVTLILKRGFNNEPYYAVEPFDLLPFKLGYLYESKISLNDGKV